MERMVGTRTPKSAERLRARLLDDEEIDQMTAEAEEEEEDEEDQEET